MLKGRNDILKVLREKNYEPRILNPGEKYSSGIKVN